MGLEDLAPQPASGKVGVNEEGPDSRGCEGGIQQWVNGGLQLVSSVERLAPAPAPA